MTGMEQRERPCSQVNEAGEAQTGGVGRGQLKVTCLWPSVTGTRQMSESGRREQVAGDRLRFVRGVQETARLPTDVDLRLSAFSF